MKSASILALGVAALGLSTAQAQNIQDITVDLGEEFIITSSVETVSHDFTIKGVPAGEENLIAVLYQEDKVLLENDNPTVASFDVEVPVVGSNTTTNVTVEYQRRETVIQGEFYAECTDTGYLRENIKLGQHRNSGAKGGDVHSAWAIPLTEGDNVFSFCYSMRGGIVGNLNDVLNLKIQRRDPNAFIPLEEARFMEFVNGTDIEGIPAFKFTIVGNYEYDPTMYIVTIATGVATVIVMGVCTVDVLKNGCAVQEDDEDEK